MDKIHVRFSVSQPCLTDAVIVILNGLLSYEHPSKKRGLFFCMQMNMIRYSVKLPPAEGRFKRRFCRSESCSARQEAHSHYLAMTQMASSEGRNGKAEQCPS